MRHELGHTLLARLGKKRLRPGGIGDEYDRIG